MVVDDTFIQTYVDLRLIRTFDHSLLKNIGNIGPKLVNRPADPNNDYYIPSFYGMTGIGCNKRLIQEPKPSAKCYVMQNMACATRFATKPERPKKSARSATDAGI